MVLGNGVGVESDILIVGSRFQMIVDFVEDLMSRNEPWLETLNARNLERKKERKEKKGNYNESKKGRKKEWTKVEKGRKEWIKTKSQPPPPPLTKKPTKNSLFFAVVCSYLGMRLLQQYLVEHYWQTEARWNGLY